MSSTPFLPQIYFRPAVSRWPAIFQAWMPVLLFGSIFAIESNAAFGADHTSRPLHDFFQIFMGSAVDNGWTFTHHTIRKIGHFCAYGSFSLVLFRGFWLSLRDASTSFRRRIRLHRTLPLQLLTHALAIGATFLVASADEIHQTFLPNRTGTFSDVILDSTGALAFQTLLFVILRIAANWPSPPARYMRMRALRTRRHLPLAA